MRKKGEQGGGGDYTWTFLVRFKGQFYGIKQRKSHVRYEMAVLRKKFVAHF